MENFSAKTETVLFVLTLWVLNWRIPPVASTTMVYEPTTSYETETSNSSAEHKTPQDNQTAGATQMLEKWRYMDLAECLETLGPERAFPTDGLYCNGTFDMILCWPAARAGSLVRQPCPPLKGLDHTKTAFRRCGLDGRWLGKVEEDARPEGWTNFTECFPPRLLDIKKRLFENLDSQQLKEIAEGTRIMEMVGLSVSLLSLSISLFIFCYYRSLKCDRTRIHRNLFIAIIIHVLVSLCMHIDEFIAKSQGTQVGGSVVDDKGTLSNTPILCETLITVVEYTKTVMFMWMFIEGMYLHFMLVVSVFSTSKPNYPLFYLLGWGFPVILTLAWAMTNSQLQKDKCWFTYTFQRQFWIIEGPRAAIIVINLIFLLNIIRVLLTKLRESNTNEALQVRKAVKAAIVLLPLLGVNNFLAMVHPPMSTLVEFGLWSYVSHFLTSFQGFFISLLYCFLNGEVQDKLRRSARVRYEFSRIGNMEFSQIPPTTAPTPIPPALAEGAAGSRSAALGGATGRFS